MSEFHDEPGTDEAGKKNASGKMSRRELLVSIGAAGVAAAAGGLLQANASVASGERQSVVQATYGAPTVAACPDQPANIKDFGAIGDGIYHPLSEIYNTLGAAQADYAFVTSLAQSVDWAAAQAALNTLKATYAPAGRYVMTNTLELRGNLFFGDGIDGWEHMDAGATLKYERHGTHLYMYGMGAKAYTSAYNNREKTTGGVVVNSTPYSSGDATYELFDFTNADATAASPATLKPFSVGIYIPPNMQGSAVRDMRIVPYFNGIEGYRVNTGYQLADDWDVGVFQDSCCQVEVTNVQVVGYWRIAAYLMGVSSDYGKLREAYGISGSSVTPSGKGFDTHLDLVRLQGQVGMMIRGGCFYRAVSCTADTVAIPWDESHPFPAAGYPDRTFSSPKGTFTYASWTKSGDQLVFAGVSPNPAAAGLVTNPIRYGGHYGIGGSTVKRSLITGLEHASLRNASDSNTIGRYPSKCLELHGNSIRNICFEDTYFQTRQDVFLHVHNFSDLRFVRCQFEGSNFKNGAGSYGTGGVRVIASPEPALNTRVAYPAGFSHVELLDTFITGAADFYPRLDTGITTRFTGDGGLFQPRYLKATAQERPPATSRDHVERRANAGQGIRDYSRTDWGVAINGNSSLALQVTSGGNVNIATGQLSFTGGSAFINSASGQSVYLRNGTTVSAEISPAGQVLPTVGLTDNSLGSSSRVWTAAYAAKYMFTPTVGAFYGMGTPEGAVAAGVGSTYHRTDGGADTSFYVKEAGSGNTGWVAK